MLGRQLVREEGLTLFETGAQVVVGGEEVVGGGGGRVVGYYGVDEGIERGLNALQLRVYDFVHLWGDLGMYSASGSK